MYDTVIGGTSTYVHGSDEGMAIKSNSDSPLPLNPLEAPEIRRVGAHTENPIINPFQGIPGIDQSRFEDPVIKRALAPAPDGPTSSNIPGIPDRPWSSIEAEIHSNTAMLTKELVDKPKEQAKICKLII